MPVLKFKSAFEQIKELRAKLTAKQQKCLAYGTQIHEYLTTGNCENAEFIAQHLSEIKEIEERIQKLEPMMSQKDRLTLEKRALELELDQNSDGCLASAIILQEIQRIESELSELAG